MKFRIFSIMFALVLVLGISLIITAPALANGGTTWYVDPLGTDDPSHGLASGTDAFQTIGYALSQATSGDTINVAAGTYEENITLRDGVSVYGAGDDVTTIDGDSSGTVVYADTITSATTFDGFTIQNGSGYDDSGTTYGGGMYITNSSSSLTVSNCTFTGNSNVTFGGGMYNEGSSPTVTDCLFSANLNAQDGGGMYNNVSSSPSLTDCDFTSNSAEYLGGGMYNRDASEPSLISCDFIDNSAYVDGGGMYNTSSSPTLTDCDFDGNTATTNGGGIHNDHNSSPTVTNCEFTSNDATWNGGGIYNYDYSSPTVTDCFFTDNSAVEMGGGMSSYASSSPTLTNCIFDANTVTNYGGGVGSFESSPTVVNCTFYDNAADWGGGIFSMDSDSAVKNCIVAENQATTAGGGIYVSGDSPTIDYNDVWGNTLNGVTPDNYSGCSAGTNDISADPRFVSASGLDYSLWVTSPCVDAGNNNAVPVGVTTDIRDYPRFIDGNGDGTATVDMGAYENVAQVWVDDDYCDVCDNDGHTWDVDAFDNIQDGVNAVAPGGKVNVHPGDYTEMVTIINKSLTVESVSGDWHDTTIDPVDYVFGLLGDGGQFSGDVTISGFTLTNSGYGVYISDGLAAGSTVTVSNCLLHDNNSVGIYGMGTLDGDIFIDDCIIADNGMGPAGGIHLAAVGGTVEITDSVIGAYWDATTSTAYAGNGGNGIDIGVIAATGNVLIDGNKIVGNGGYGISDGISGLAGQLTITNNVIGAYDYDLTSANGFFDGNESFGIFIDSWAPGGVLTIEGNRIAENYTGIMITATVAGECLINNNYVGAWTEYIDVGGEIYTQTFTGNVRYGMVIAGVGTDASLTIINNKVAENSTIGPGVALLVFGNNGNTIISANHVGAWTQDIPGGVPVSYGGNYCSGIAIMSAADGSLLILDNTVVGNHEPNSGIHIADVAEGVDVRVNLNDILDNTGYGVYYDYAGAGFLEEIDATNNWWGDVSGPGEAVSTHVVYEPWLGVTVDNARAGVITDGALDNVAAAGVEVIVNGSAIVTTANYSGNPGGSFSGDVGKYIDVHIDDSANVTEIEIRFYYTDAEIAGLTEASLSLSWWNGADWVSCSDSGVNTTDIAGPPAYSGYMWAKIRSDTTPTLDDLTGSVFGGRGATSSSPMGGGDTAAPRISNVSACYDGVTATTADICWTTNEKSTSQVRYWASPTMLSPLDTSYVTEHHVQLTGLTPGTTYSYQTISKDMYGNPAVSDVYTFITLEEEPPSAVFASSDLSISPSEVESGETVTVAVLVTNSGDLAGSYELTLEINGVAEETKEVTLDAGASQSVSFTVSREEAGSYSVAIDGLSGSFTVTAPASSPPADEDETLTEDESSTNWPLIWGIVGGVVVIGLIVFLVTMRRRAS